MHERQALEAERSRIQELSNESHITDVSNQLMLRKTTEILDEFPDHELINLESSIPILQ